MKIQKVLYAKAVFGWREIWAVLKSLLWSKRNNFLSVGPKSAEFEAEIAKLFGREHAVFVNSGSSANLLAVQMIPKGEVVTPALTFATTLAPLLQAGLTPVFIDSDAHTFLPTIESIESKITDKTTAVMVPNLLGNKMDSLRLRDLCDSKGILYIEDSCDTITPSNGHIVTTSFYGSHITTAMGAGGMVMTDDKAMADRMRTMRDWGRGVDVSEKVGDRYKYQINGFPYDGKFWYTELGFNMRPVEAQAAFGLEQLKRLPAFAETRKRNYWDLYYFFLRFDFCEVPELTHDGSDPNWLAFPLILNDEAPFTRFELVDWLESHGIQTRPIFSGNILRHPAYSHLGDPDGFPNSDYVMKNGVLLGIHQGMGFKEIEYIKEVFNEFVDGK